MRHIKEYCKLHKMIFVELATNGFNAYKTMPIKAGIEVSRYNGKLKYTKIKKISSKKVLRNFIIHTDGDIQDNGIFPF